MGLHKEGNELRYDNDDDDHREEYDDCIDDCFDMGIDTYEAACEAAYIRADDASFEGLRLKGKNAHAYKNEYDNHRIAELWMAGKSAREIAGIIGCASSSTVLNRVRKMGLPKH